MATPKEIKQFKDLLGRGFDQDRAKRLIIKAREGAPEPKEGLAQRVLREGSEFIGEPVQDKVDTPNEIRSIRDDQGKVLGRSGGIIEQEKGNIQKIGESISDFGTENKFNLKEVEGEESIGQQFKREFTNLGKLSANIGTDVLEIAGDAADFIGELIDNPQEKLEETKTLGKGFLGLFRKAGRFGLELGSGQKTDISEDEKLANVIGEGIKKEAVDKFGSLDKARKTLTENPLDTFLFVRGGLKGLKDSGLSNADKVKIDGLIKESDSAIKQFLDPKRIDTKQITRQITPEIQQRLKDGRLKPGDRESILAMTEENVDRIGGDIGDFIKEGKVKGEIDFGGMIDVLAEADAKLRIDGNIIPGNESSVKFINAQLEFLSQLEKTYGKNLPAAKQLELRQKYDVVFDKTITRDKITKFQDELQVSLADSLRRELAKNNPDLDKLNKDYSFNKGLQKVLDETIERKTGQDPVGLINELRKQSQGTAGAIIGGSLGSILGTPGAIFGTVAGGAIGAKIQKVLASPKYKLVDAKDKKALADAILEGDPTKVEKILDSITIAGGISELSTNE